MFVVIFGETTTPANGVLVMNVVSVHPTIIVIVILPFCGRDVVIVVAIVGVALE